MDNKKRYIKLLTKEDIFEILKAGDVKLLPDHITYSGEKVPSIQRSKNIIVCRVKLNRKNKDLDYLIEKFTSIIHAPKYYDPDDTIIFIYNFACQIASFGDDYTEENIAMTLKLKEILSQKDKDYEKDFREYWEKMKDETEENDKE